MFRYPFRFGRTDHVLEPRRNNRDSVIPVRLEERRRTVGRAPHQTIGANGAGRNDPAGIAASHVDAAPGELAFTVTKRIPRGLAEYEVKSATRCTDHGPTWQSTMLRRDLLKIGDAIGRATMPVGINHDETWATRRNSRYRLGTFAPPFTHALRVGAHGLPALDDRRLRPPAVLEIDTGRKDWQASVDEIERSRNISRLDVAGGHSVEGQRWLLFTRAWSLD